MRADETGPVMSGLVRPCLPSGLDEARLEWDREEHRGGGTWEHMKEAVRDAWDRIAHRR